MTTTSKLQKIPFSFFLFPFGLLQDQEDYRSVNTIGETSDRKGGDEDYGNMKSSFLHNDSDSEVEENLIMEKPLNPKTKGASTPFEGFFNMVNTRTDAELAAAVQAAVDAMLPQIREQVREEYRTGAVASGSNPPPVTIHTWLERFNKQKPRSFEKAVAPVDAENWISHMEKIFDVMDCNDAFKTRLVVYKFEGDALAGGKAYKQAKGGRSWVNTLTWQRSRKLVLLQFFLDRKQERLKREYHSNPAKGAK
ncbi:hypothetical protein Tco_1185687 [Tanacetum coccineum]